MEECQAFFDSYFLGILKSFLGRDLSFELQFIQVLSFGYVNWIRETNS